MLAQLAVQLTSRFGKGFDASNLRNMRRFYLAFPIQETVSLELSWSHYNLLSRIDNPAARQWYRSDNPELECAGMRVQARLEQAHKAAQE